MNMKWYPKVDLLFGVYYKSGQELKCVDKDSTHAPFTPRSIPWGVIQALSKRT